MINPFKTKTEDTTGPDVKMTFYMPNGDVKEFTSMPQAQAKRVCREIRAEQLKQYDELGIVLKAVRRHG